MPWGAVPTLKSRRAPIRPLLPGSSTARCGGSSAVRATGSCLRKRSCPPGAAARARGRKRAMSSKCRGLQAATGRSASWDPSPGTRLTSGLLTTLSRTASRRSCSPGATGSGSGGPMSSAPGFTTTAAWSSPVPAGTRMTWRAASSPESPKAGRYFSCPDCARSAGTKTSIPRSRFCPLTTRARSAKRSGPSATRPGSRLHSGKAPSGPSRP